jgi:hypothetical protein
MGKDFRVTITNPEREEEFLKVFGRTTVNVESPIPHMASIPGKGRCRIYKLDLNLISEEEREKLVAHIAEKFKLNPEFVKAELARAGLPILADECTVVISNPQRWI